MSRHGANRQADDEGNGIIAELVRCNFPGHHSRPVRARLRAADEAQLAAPGRTVNADSRPLSATESAETPSQIRADGSGSPNAGDSLSGGPR